MAVIVITPPAEEPVSLAEAKGHLRVDHDQEDTYIEGLIVAAREFCEGKQHRAYVTQTLEYSLNSFPGGYRIELPKPPLQSVVSVTYTDEDGADHPLDPGTYVVDSRSLVGAVVLKRQVTWPQVTLAVANGFRIRYVAGYGVPSAVPHRVKQAMLLLIGHWYEHREEVVAGVAVNRVPVAAEALLVQGKVF